MSAKRARPLGLAVCLIAAASLLNAAASADVPGPNAVTIWNANAGDAALAACIAPTDDPLHESRLYAMTQIVAFTTLNAIDRRSRPYAFDGDASPATSPDAAVASAAREVLVTLLGQPVPVPAVHRRRHRERGGGLRGRTRRDPGRHSKGAGRRATAQLLRQFSSSEPTTDPAHRSWPSTTPRAQPGRVAVHARLPVCIRTGMGGCDPVRAARQLAVPHPRRTTWAGASTPRTSTR